MLPQSGQAFSQPLVTCAADIFIMQLCQRIDLNSF